MAHREDGGPELLDVLSRVVFQLQESVDFEHDDTANTLLKVRLLTAAAIYFNVLSVADFGGKIGPVRGDGLLEQVVAAAFQSFGGSDPHPGPFDKAAMLLRGITQGHPFNDGNKRTGLLLAAFYLEQVGYPPPSHLDEEPVVTFCFRVSAGEIRDVEVIAATLRRL